MSDVLVQPHSNFRVYFSTTQYQSRPLHDISTTVMIPVADDFMGSESAANELKYNILFKKRNTYLVCFRIELMFKNSTNNQVHYISFCS